MLLKFADYLKLELKKDIPPLVCDTLIHCASAASDIDSLDQLRETNVEGLKNLLLAQKFESFYLYFLSLCLSARQGSSGR